MASVGRRSGSVVLGALAFAGCNALTGAEHLGTGEDEVAPIPDRVPGAPDGGGAPAKDAAPAADVQAPADAARGPLRVFATSAQQRGDFGGVAGADTICAKAAQAAAIDGRFVAWMSTRGGVDAIDRLTVDGEWRLVSTSGPRVAADKAALASGALEHSIDRDETGARLPTDDDRVWTGTAPSGEAGAYDCAGWTSASGLGIVGEGAQRDRDWTTLVAEPCAQMKRVYCFEQ